MKNKRNLLVIIAMFAIVGLSFAQDGTTYKIGDTGPGGGIVFYDKGSFSNGWRYLEAAPVDQSTRKKNEITGKFEGGLIWRSKGTFVSIETTSREIGTGKANTAAILALDPTAPAAKVCRDYRGGGKSDWFLPSLDELAIMFDCRSALGDPSGLYWSSTQYSNVHPGQNFAYSVNLTIGNTELTLGGTRATAGLAFGNVDRNDAKIMEFSVRAIRAF